MRRAGGEVLNIVGEVWSSGGGVEQYGRCGAVGEVWSITGGVEQ